MRLFLVRHGLARSNLENPASCLFDPRFAEVEGRDCSLTPQGEKQAELTGLRLKDIEIDHVFCSPMHRALSTCAGIIGQQKNHLQIEISHELPEVGCHGIIPMPDELIRTVWDDIYMPPVPAPIPEPSDDTRFDRAERFTTELFRRFGDTDKNILIVSHGHFLHQYLVPTILMLPRAIRGRYRFASENASITVINIKDGNFFALTVDETAHLGSDVSREPYLL